MPSHPQRQHRHEGALEALVNSASCVVRRDYVQAALLAGVGIVHLSHLLGEVGLNKALAVARKLQDPELGRAGLDEALDV